MFMASFVFGCSITQLKYTKTVLEDKYTPNQFMFLRSILSTAISIILIKINNVEIVAINKVNHKFWFQIRTTSNYVSFMALIHCMIYLRSTTAACFNSLKPVFVLILSILILKEIFYFRYVWGLAICICGVILIVSNDRSNTNDKKTSNNLLYGTLFGIVHMSTVALNNISNKIMITEKIRFEVLSFWTGLNNVLSSVIYSLISNEVLVNLNVTLVFHACFNSIMIYIAQFLVNRGLSLIDLSKTTAISFTATLTVFILGVCLLGETLYLTDILGSLLILGFNVYNSYYPL
jgi:drug/metabolite transporter (DMT)-like permease